MTPGIRVVPAWIAALEASRIPTILRATSDTRLRGFGT